MDAAALLEWIDAYEEAWRTPGSAALARLFTDRAVYLQSPYAQPVVGLAAIGDMWDAERDGPDEPFTFTREVVAVDGPVGVARVEVGYGAPVSQEDRNLWVVQVGPDGRAERFEEWPFWPSKGATPAAPLDSSASGALVVGTAEVPASPWAEVARSGSLSAGVYALGTGDTDRQSPHGQDEVYVVVTGAADLVVDGKRRPVRAGTLAYLPAHVEHRFVDITSALRVAVVFAPPEELSPPAARPDGP